MYVAGGDWVADARLAGLNGAGPSFPIANDVDSHFAQIGAA